MLRVIAILTCILPAMPLVAQDAAEMALAKQVLTVLQAKSFSARREYCGYIAFDRTGALVATDPVAGDMASCAADFPTDVAVIASYHTHGAYDAGYFNEMPSTIDVDSDSAFYMDGYVATPGGRFWYVDGRARTATQLCDQGCLPTAPDFMQDSDGAVALHYTYDELRRLQE